MTELLNLATDLVEVILWLKDIGIQLIQLILTFIKNIL